MIYCIRHSEVHDCLISLGYVIRTETEHASVYFLGRSFLALKKPNVHGTLPEIWVEEAFNAAGLAPPKLDVFWCD